MVEKRNGTGEGSGAGGDDASRASGAMRLAARAGPEGGLAMKGTRQALLEALPEAAGAILAHAAGVTSLPATLEAPEGLAAALVAAGFGEARVVGLGWPRAPWPTPLGRPDADGVRVRVVAVRDHAVALSDPRPDGATASVVAYADLAELWEFVDDPLLEATLAAYGRVSHLVHHGGGKPWADASWATRGAWIDSVRAAKDVIDAREGRRRDNRADVEAMASVGERRGVGPSSGAGPTPAEAP